MFEKKKRKYTKRRKAYRKRTYRKRSSAGRTRKPSLLGKIFNTILAILSISALILLISLIIGEIYNADKSTLSGKMSTIFTKFNLNSGKIVADGRGNFVEEFALVSKPPSNKLLYKICLLSDIHQDKDNLNKTLPKIQSSECEKIFVIGDVTNYGDVNSLREIRTILDGLNIEYYAIPGDHDIAQSLSAENFNQVFGTNYHIMEYKDTAFLLIDNSANYTSIGNIQMSWIEKNIGKVDFVVASQPLFTEGLNPPFASTYMGSMPSAPESDTMRPKQEEVREQGRLLLDMIRKNSNVRAIFAGEHHRSSNLEDPVRSSLKHYVVGAVTSTVNDLPQNAIQSSRFSVLSIYEGDEYYLEDVVID